MKAAATAPTPRSRRGDFLFGGGGGADVIQAIATPGEAPSARREMRAGLNESRRRVDGLDGKVDGLRQAVTSYHASVLGHAIVPSELDARLRRVGRHLNPPPAAWPRAARCPRRRGAPVLHGRA